MLAAVVLVRVSYTNTLSSRLQIIAIQPLAVTQPVVSLMLVVILNSWALLNLHPGQVERRVRLQVLVSSAACWKTLKAGHLLLSLLNLLLVLLKLFGSSMQL